MNDRPRLPIYSRSGIPTTFWEWTRSSVAMLGVELPRVLVVLPTYNECMALPMLVGSILRLLPSAHILVIDDNSPDGTGQVAADLARAECRVLVLNRAGKLGIGSALVQAIHRACRDAYDVLITMDADLSHDPADLPVLVDAMQRYDLVIGSRHVPGGAAPGCSWRRRLVSRLISAFMRTLLRIPVRDASSGYRGYRVDLLRVLRLGDLSSAGYAFEEELLYSCYSAGARIVEVPIVYRNRCHGQSKVNYRELCQSGADLLRLGLASIFRVREMRRSRL